MPTGNRLTQPALVGWLLVLEFAKPHMTATLWGRIIVHPLLWYMSIPPLPLPHITPHLLHIFGLSTDGVRPVSKLCPGYAVKRFPNYVSVGGGTFWRFRQKINEF